MSSLRPCRGHWRSTLGAATRDGVSVNIALPTPPARPLRPATTPAVFGFDVFSAPVSRPLAEYAGRRHTGWRVREHRAANAACTTVETSHNASTSTSCATLDACPSTHHRPLLAGKQRIRSPPPIRPPLPAYGPELQPPLHPETTPPSRRSTSWVTAAQNPVTATLGSINAMLSLSILLLLLELSRSKKRQHGGVVLGTTAAATHLTFVAAAVAHLAAHNAERGQGAAAGRW
uniref:Uncharacterized protein n=1 Tax=Oryza meridionalis TaxID=40149 RepID=A0A0E0CR70_9ORYZ